MGVPLRSTPIPPLDVREEIKLMGEILSIAAVGLVGLLAIIVVLSLRHIGKPEAACFHCIMIGFLHVLILVFLSVLFVAPEQYHGTARVIYFSIHPFFIVYWTMRGKRYESLPD